MKRMIAAKGALLGSVGMALVAATIATPALAQSTVAPEAPADTAQADNQIRDIVVTGTNIPRPNMESNSPISVIDDKEMKLRGSIAVEETLTGLPQFTADANDNASNGSDGTANINLRDLGSNRVLTLINGQRLLPTQATDLNFVPSFMVQRVDVLTGGASAVYGADAVSGVVNFILKDDLQGIRFDSTLKFYQHDNNNRSLRDLISSSGYENAPRHVADGGKYQLSLAAGTNFADGRGNVTAYVGYQHTDPIAESQRDVSACALDPLDSTNSSLRCGGSSNNAYGLFTILSGPNAGQTVVNSRDGTKTFVPYDSSYAYNYAPSVYFQRSDARYTGGAFAHYDFSPAATLYGSFMFMDDHTFSQVAPSAIFQGTTFHINCDNPFMSVQQANLLCGAQAGTDADADAFIGYRPTGPGSSPRRDDLRHTDYRISGGLRGKIAEGINYDVSALRSIVIFDENYQNDISNAPVQKGLQVVNVNGTPTCKSVIDGTDPDCVPLDVFGVNNISGAAFNYIYQPTFTHGVNKETVYSAKVNGTLGSYGISSPWASDGVGFAVGLEHRREYLRFTADELAQSKGTNNAFGTISVNEAYGELQVPILQDLSFAKELSIDGGFRYSHYRNRGEAGQSSTYSTSTYKVELSYAPTADIRFRASYNRAIRAPNISELFASQALGNVFATDTCAGSNPTASLANCEASGVTAAQYGHIPECPASFCVAQGGGNPDLDPEKADTYTIGAILTPRFIPSLTLSVDYYHIKVKNYISSIDAGLIINQCLESGNPFFCALFHRDPHSGVLFGNEGYVQATTLNTGYLQTDGIDLTGNYSVPIGGLGKLNFDFYGTYLHRLVTEPLPGLGSYDCAGLYGPSCGQPAAHWRHTLRTTWATPWTDTTLSLNWRYRGGTEVTYNQSNPLLSGDHYVYDAKIKPYSYFDLAATTTVARDIALRVGMNNIFDKDPPAIVEPLGTSFINGNTFPGTYDALGRTIFVGVTAQF
ncbi:MAG: TonB-dependent receptor domain-containing protein [Sphingomonas sp.]